MFHSTDDERIAGYRPLISPAILMEELPVSEQAASTVAEARRAAEAVVRGEDDRLLVVTGPCSIHDPKAALEYADRLHSAKRALHVSACNMDCQRPAEAGSVWRCCCSSCATGERH